jgi:hypothetical protein
MIKHKFKLSQIADPTFTQAARELAALSIDTEDSFNFAEALIAASEAAEPWKVAHLKALETSGGIKVGVNNYQMDEAAQAKYYQVMKPLEAKEHTFTLPKKLILPRGGKNCTASVLLFFKFVEMAPKPAP